MMLQFANIKAEAIADDNSGATFIFFSGTFGLKSHILNGMFEPTKDMGQDGRVVYIKCADRDHCIEHFRGEWQVKHVAMRGKNVCWAYVTGGCGLEACRSRVWSVTDGFAFVAQPQMKMATGCDAELQVKCRRL
jgi:hypothetical protein